MSHVFISYVRANEVEVHRLCEQLRSEGVDIWRDRDKIAPGENWKQAIRHAIKEGAYFIACFSKEYKDRERSYMNEELTIAIEELRLRPRDRAWFIPAIITECEVPDRQIGAGETLCDIQWVKLYEDWETGVLRILQVLEKKTANGNLSAEARAIARSLFEAAELGPGNIIQATIDDIAEETGIAPEAVLEAVEDLEALIFVERVRGTISHTIQPTLRLFLDFAQEVDGYNPKEDARTLLRRLLRRKGSGSSCRKLANEENWSPRRINIALYFLEGNDLIETAGVDLPFACSEIWSSSRSSPFMKGLLK